MNSWVYIFSRFTPEALLFEALVICILLAGYAGFWVLKKRKLGPVQVQVPAGVVKGYLNELIVDATQLRAQLFGLLSAAGVSTEGLGPSAAELAAKYAAAAGPAMPTNAVMADPALGQKLGALESKLAQQASAMEALLAEKARIEKELNEARAGGGGGAGASADGEVSKLKDKISSLEGKLAEYSVIEDDLANLKRLQQENAQLKAALGGKGGAGAVAAAPAAPAPAPAAAAAAPVAEPVLETPPAAAAPAGDQFEGLVDQVEQSLQPAAEASPMGALDAAPAAEAAPAAANEGKSDADLVAEFEKMLSG